MITDINSLITISPEIRYGRPCIAETGISVHRIAIWYKLGHSPEEIARRYAHLNLAQVYAALSYYHVNRNQIDAEIEAEAAEADNIEQQYLQKMRIAS